MSLDEVAKTWLTDPPWQKVFKHTFDVCEDYISYLLITVGAIFLSVRLLTTLGTGDLNCVILGVENETIGGIDPYPSGGTLGLINYASSDDQCVSAVLSKYMEYLPYILLIQTIILVIVEKFTFKIPRIAQKVERFYKNIVEDSLFGKDPDVSEDLTDPKTSTEVISRRRQRNEICVSLKRSKIIGRVYVAKNLFEIILNIIFLSLNIAYVVTMEDDLPRTCHIKISGVESVSDGSIPGDHEVYFQCRGKKMKFFAISLYVQIVLLALHALCSIGAIVWCIGFRSISNLLRKISKDENKIMGRGRGGSNEFLSYRNGNDFLFLFDLLAHTCGIESTLRVLTHSDDNFYETCRPKVDILTDLTLEEDKLKIIWRPADIEKLFRRNTFINIESYEVTIFPAETVQNTCTIPANTYVDENSEDPIYSIWFFDLSGGRTEYVITIACMIGKSRMKGEKVVTNLLPYGPDMPRSGMIKSVGADQGEIFWDPPKGEFTKYTLEIERIYSDKIEDVDFGTMWSKTNCLPGQIVDKTFSTQLSTNLSSRKIENLSFKLTYYTILGLEPGEAYRVELKTKTGNVETRQAISDVLLTKPDVVEGILISDIDVGSCMINWIHPDKGHSRLKGFQIKIERFSDSKVIRVLAVKKTETSFKVLGLTPGTDYNLEIDALCSYKNVKTESAPSEVGLTTLPESPKDLRLDSLPSTNSAVLKWEPAAQAQKYRISVDSDEINYHNVFEMPGDRAQFNVTKIPDVTGTGRRYKVAVTTVVQSIRSNQEVSSQKSVTNFVTRPLAPTNLRLSQEEKLTFFFDPSLTETVSKYRVKWKGEEGVALEAIVSDENEGPIKFVFPSPLMNDVIYKINVYALVDDEESTIESKELHEKIILQDKSQILSLYQVE